MNEVRKAVAHLPRRAVTAAAAPQHPVMHIPGPAEAALAGDLAHATRPDLKRPPNINGNQRQAWLERRIALQRRPHTKTRRRAAPRLERPAHDATSRAQSAASTTVRLFTAASSISSSARAGITYRPRTLIAGNSPDRIAR